MSGRGFSLLAQERGIALLIVVSMLAVIGIMGVAFAFSMYLETQATRQFVSATQARYLAEAGVSHARALLDEDRLGSRIDDTTERWGQAPKGSDVDVDGDGARDATWWSVPDAGGQPVGRYGLVITDEAGKANVNATVADPSSSGPVGAINLTMVLAAAGLPNPSEAAQAIERYRYGADGKPGVADSDDDGDGTIDEPDEYQPLALRGDDRRCESLEELVAVAHLRPQDLPRLSRLATVYSWDLNVSVTGKARVNVNTATAAELLPVLLEAGVEDPWQAAANMSDYADPDLEMSKVIRASSRLVISDQGPLGGWVWRNDQGGHYAAEEPDGPPLSWAMTVPAGTFRVLARGLPGMKVGDITIGGQLKRSVSHGESLGTFTLGGPLTVEVQHHEPDGTTCAFRGLELVSEDSQSGVVVRGVEAVRFNELMIRPMTTLAASAASFEPQGSDWGCPLGSPVCSNSGVGQGKWTWTNAQLHPGRYYVRVFGAEPGHTVGEVRVDGQSQLLIHGQSHPSTLEVGPDGKITLTIGKTASEGTYYFDGLSLSLEPDAEYLELINLSDRDIDVSGWTIEGELTGGRQARLPSGAVIKAHGLLLAAVDLDDEQLGLEGNGISARAAWAIADDAEAVQLEFVSGPPSADDDWLKNSVPGGSLSRLLLRAGDVVVDEVEYPLPPPVTADFQSLEKGDPTVIVDTDHDGVDEGWYPSLQLYTPAAANDNNGLREVVGLETVVHDPSKEITIYNRSLSGIGELAGLASGQAWKPFASADLANMVDRLTVEGLRLEAEGRLVGGAEAWQERAEGDYEHSHVQQPEVAGRWEWTHVPEGRYRFSLYGWRGEQLSIRWRRNDESFTEWSPALTADAQGRVVVGQIGIGPLAAGPPGMPEAQRMEETPPNTLTVEVLCASPGGVCHLDAVRLDPQLMRVGPVNVNTAPREVLLALPGMTDALADRILAGRPYGDKEQKGRGIGDLLLGDTLGAEEEDRLAAFQRLAHVLTTRSDVFTIISLGQAMDGERPGATQRILTVVER